MAGNIFWANSVAYFSHSHPVSTRRNHMDQSLYSGLSESSPRGPLKTISNGLLPELPRWHDHRPNPRRKRPKFPIPLDGEHDSRHINGHMNGHVNGHINGHANGYTRQHYTHGLVPYQRDRHKNGYPAHNRYIESHGRVTLYPSGGLNQPSPTLEKLKQLNATYSQIERLNRCIKLCAVVFLICGTVMTLSEVIRLVWLWMDLSHTQRIQSETDLLYSLHVLLMGVLSLSAMSRRSASAALVLTLLNASFLSLHILLPLYLPVTRRMMELTERFFPGQRRDFVDSVSTAAPNPVRLNNGVQALLACYVAFAITSVLNSIAMLLFGVKLYRLL